MRSKIIKKIETTSGLPFLQEIICFSVSIDQFLFSFLPTLTKAMLHPNHAFKAFVVQMFEEVLIIYFPCVWFTSSRIVPYLKVCNFIPGPVHMLNQMTFIFFLIVGIKKYFTGWTIYRLTNQISLG